MNKQLLTPLLASEQVLEDSVKSISYVIEKNPIDIQILTGLCEELYEQLRDDISKRVAATQTLWNSLFIKNNGFKVDTFTLGLSCCKVDTTNMYVLLIVKGVNELSHILMIDKRTRKKSITYLNYKINGRETSKVNLYYLPTLHPKVYYADGVVWY